MRVLFLSRYHPNGASSRLRHYAIAEGLAARGFDCQVRPLFSPAYLERLYAAGSRRGAAGDILRSYLGRLGGLGDARGFDVTVVEKELFPRLPFALERPFLARLPRLITDHDDAVQLLYSGRWLAGKIDRVMAHSRAVVVGSAALEEAARRHCDRVRRIPTVVDPAAYTPRQHDPRADGRRAAVRIGWIGTPVTAPFLAGIAPALRAVAGRLSIELVAIGAPAGFALDGVPTRRLPWSREAEAAALATLDLGIMPLPDTDFARAKCGYKLVQYMAAGLPTVASAVGENRLVTVEGKTGLLAADTAGWVEAIERLAGDPAGRAAMGREGRARVESSYSLPVAVAAWAELIEELARLPARA